MSFLPEICSDFSWGYQSILVLDGNDALLKNQLLARHGDGGGAPLGSHIDPAIPASVSRISYAVKNRPEVWVHGQPPFLNMLRIALATNAQPLVNSYFADPTAPVIPFVFSDVVAETRAIAAWSPASAVTMESPHIAIWGGRATNTLQDFPSLGLSSLVDGGGFVKITDAQRDKLLDLPTGDEIADALDLVGDRITVLESDTIPLNGNFEFYDGATFRNWTGTFDATGLDPGGGRYIQLGSTSRSMDSDEFAIPGDYTLLEVLYRSNTAGPTASGSVAVRWYTSAHGFISSTTTGITAAAANTWEVKVATLSPPATAAYAIVRIGNEGGITLQYGAVRIRQPSMVLGAFGSTPSASGASYDGRTYANQPANGSNPGGISLGAQKLGTGEKSADSFKGTGANTTATLAGATQVLRAESTSSSGQAVLDFFVNAVRRALIRGDSFGNLVSDATGSIFQQISGATQLLLSATTGLGLRGSTNTSAGTSVTANNISGRNRLTGTTYTVTNSLVTTSSQIFVTPHADPGSGVRWYTTAGSGTFTVTFTSSVTNMDFSWLIVNPT